MPRPHSCCAIPPPTVVATATTSTNTKRESPSTTDVDAARRMLMKISHIELADFHKVDGVKYYVVNVYEKTPRRRSAGGSATSLHMRRLTHVTNSNQPTTTDPAKPKLMHRIVKRFRDFEELRRQLQKALATGKSKDTCACCDAFTTFLACGSMQPGLLTKWLMREHDRKQVLEQNLNQLVKLAVMPTTTTGSHTSTSTDTNNAEQDVCAVKHRVPWILQQFMRGSTEHKTRKLRENDELLATSATTTRMSVM